MSIPGIDQKEYLASDFNVQCWGSDGKHKSSVVIAIICLFVYVIGVPLAILVLLFINRAHLHDTTSKRHEKVVYFLGGLYNQVSETHEEDFYLIHFHLFEMATSGSFQVVFNFFLTNE